MTIKIEFKTANAAFEDPMEAGAIIRSVAEQIDAGRTEGSISDSNGNRIGKYTFRR